MGCFLPYIKNQKGSIPAIVIILIVLLGLAVTLKLSQTTQIFKPKAYDNQSRQTKFSSNGLNIEVLQWVTDEKRFAADHATQPSVLVDNTIYFREAGTDFVSSILINDQGNLTDIVAQKPLPKNLISGSLVNYNRYLYYIGGVDSSTVYKSKILENGILSDWQEATNLPTNINNSSAFSYKDKIYILGGAPVSDNIYSVSINQDGSLGSVWEEIGRLPQEIGFRTSVAFDGTYLYLSAGGSVLYSSKILENGRFEDWKRITVVDRVDDPEIHILEGKLLLVTDNMIFHTPVLNGQAGLWTKSDFSDISMRRDWIFSKNKGYSLAGNNFVSNDSNAVRSIVLSFGEPFPTPTPSPTASPAITPSPTPSNGIPTPPNPDARVSDLRVYYQGAIDTVYTDNLLDYADAGIRFRKTRGINAVNLWIDYCERWNRDGSCNFETGEIITQKYGTEIPLDEEGLFNLTWPNTHIKHTPGTHKIGVHAYYCTPGTKDCFGFPVIYQDVNIVPNAGGGAGGG